LIDVTEKTFSLIYYNMWYAESILGDLLHKG